MVARFLQVRVWELSEVPEHYKQEALVIIAATRGAAWHRAKEAGGAQPVIDVTNLFPM